MGRQIVAAGLLESSDTEVFVYWDFIFFGIICARVAHHEHQQRLGKKRRILMSFREVENFSKNFPKFFFAKTRQRIVSFESRARLSKIEVLESILEHFEIFRFFEFFQKKVELSKIREKILEKFQNALKSLIINILCSNRRTELQLGLRSV